MPPHTSILLLAAGGSSRFGRPKQLLPCRGTTLVRFLANEACSTSASDLIVVVGSDGDRIRKELSGLSLRVVANDAWRQGVSSSIKAGLEAAGTADALLIMLCDQPFVTAPVLNSILDPFFTSGKHLVACEYSDTLGVPALFGKEFFPELRQLQGDSGAKSILLRHAGEVHRIPFPSGSIDIDTLEDLENL